jgi:hypothetical protein
VLTIGVKLCTAPMTTSECGSQGGMLLPNCPSDATLYGCCQSNGNGGFSCYYDAAGGGSGQSNCMRTGGAWTTTVPAPTW